MEKFDELIRRQLSVVINQMLPDSFISVTAVHVSKDLSFAKIWVSSTTEMESNIKRLKSLEPSIKTELANEIVARKIPKLYFVADTTEEEAQKIEKLISSIKTGNETN